MKKVFSRPKTLFDVELHYCPGCGHGIIHRLLCEVIDETGVRGKSVAFPPAGCGVLLHKYIDIDMGGAPHGRGAALATGFKRVRPDMLVFTYQGDGDLAAIGTAETVHAANRGENITVIFVNNAVYGMTGGQMAPTTLEGMTTTTTPRGRDPKTYGYPIPISEMLALSPGVAYIERVAVNSPKNIRRAKKAIRKAFEIQMKGLGFTMVEIVSQCPTNWKMKPIEACRWIDEVMVKTYPLGVIKDVTNEG